MKNNKRATCTGCKRKLYVRNMKSVNYPLLHLNAYHCIKCLSLISDNLQNVNNSKPRLLLELFSGSKSVSRAAVDNFKYKAITIDIEPKYLPRTCTNIQYLRLNDIHDRKNISVIWASLPCTYYTVMNLHDHWKKIPIAHRRYYYLPVSSEARSAVRLLEKTLWIIRCIKPFAYFIENPRGALRHMPQINSIPFMHTVSYNDYGTAIYKPTDIFTNVPGLKLKPLTSSVGKTFTESVAKMNSSYERSIVPSALINDILSQIEYVYPRQ